MTVISIVNDVLLDVSRSRLATWICQTEAEPSVEQLAASLRADIEFFDLRDVHERKAYLTTRTLDAILNPVGDAQALALAKHLREECGVFAVLYEYRERLSQPILAVLESGEPQATTAVLDVGSETYVIQLQFVYGRWPLAGRAMAGRFLDGLDATFSRWQARVSRELDGIIAVTTFIDDEVPGEDHNCRVDAVFSSMPSPSALSKNGRCVPLMICNVLLNPIEAMRLQALAGRARS